MKNAHWCLLLFLIFLLLCLQPSDAHPLDLLEKQLNEQILKLSPDSQHNHHHHKHHIRHKHRRRSLNSEESDATKTQRNKQIMLTKPYWPWP